MLGDQDVGLAGDDVLEVVAGLAGAQRRALLGRVVADEDDGPAGLAPVREQRGDVLLAGGVVARAPVLGVVEALLDVDDEQGGVVGHDDDGDAFAAIT